MKSGGNIQELNTYELEQVNGGFSFFWVPVGVYLCLRLTQVIANATGYERVATVAGNVAEAMEKTLVIVVQCLTISGSGGGAMPAMLPPPPPPPAAFL